jgi:hypothetical protein
MELFVFNHMPTYRRKSQIYPVALAIALCVASSARAQLCLTGAERTGVPVYANKTNAALMIESPCLLELTPQQIAPVGLNFDSKFSQGTALPELMPTLAAPKARPVQSVSNIAIRSKNDITYKLLLAITQPKMADADLQLVFVD